MGKKAPPGPAGADVRPTLILMQETASMPPEAPGAQQHYPQEAAAAAGGDMVTPRASARGKKFWLVDGADADAEEAAALMHRPAEEADHEPSPHGDDCGAPDRSRAGHLWRVVSTCCRDARQACRHVRCGAMALPCAALPPAPVQRAV